MKPYKSELILPPKKKKYLHYLAEADDDNQIINNPFSPAPETHSTRAQGEESQPPTTATQTTIAPVVSSHYSAFGVVPGRLGASTSPEQLAPLQFNPTPTPAAGSSRGASNPDTKTFSDVLDEHISRLIIQNDVIVSKQPAVVMSKRGRSRDTSAMGNDSGEASSSSRISPSAAGHSESMVKTLLSSKITRKTMLKENSAGRPQVSFVQHDFLSSPWTWESAETALKLAL